MKKTILFIEFCPNSGSANGLRTELEYLRKNYKNEFESIVISRPQSIFEEASKKIGFKLYTHDAFELNDFWKNPLRAIFLYPKTVLFILKIAIKHNPDLIHCNHYMWSPYVNPVGFILNKQVIVHLKDVWLLKPKISRILMKFNPKTKYIAVSNHVYDLFTKAFNLNGKKTTVIYDPVDENIFYPPNRKKITEKHKINRKHIVYMSRIAEVRDIEIFIDVAAYLIDKHPNLKFFHYGYEKKYVNKKYFQSLLDRVKALRLNKHFFFKNYVSNPHEVAKVLRKSYISVIPSRQFALPNTAIEAMMCGVPVIAYDTGGNSEIIKDDKMGKLVAANSAFLYAKALNAYLSGRKDYVRASVDSSKFTHQVFSTKVQIENLVSYYKKLL